MVRSALLRGDIDEAERCLDAALKRNKQDHVCYALAAELRLSQNRAPEAIALYMRAVNICPEVRIYKERFLDLVGGSIATSYNKPIASALIACLRTRDLDCSKIVRFWKSLLQAEPRFHAAFGLEDRQSFDPSNIGFFESLTDFRPLFTPLFLEGLKKLLVYDPVFEELMCHIRRHLLNDLDSARKRFSADEHVALASALSHYAFRSDFVLDVTEEERQKTLELRRRIETGTDGATDAARIAMLACHQPLYCLANARDILANFNRPGPLQDVVTAQIADYFSLREAAAAIPSITDIGDGVSTRVREQYETFPYPNWRALSKEKLVQDWQTMECHAGTERSLRGKNAKILIAGCGTGREAAVLATIFPDAAITAVDLSRTSLAYAAVRGQEHNLHNISFRHADILKLGSLESKFDYVYAMGVLHHMESPMEGWRICCGLLNPGGLMRIGLYSETGRRAVTAARNAIAKGNYSSDREGMLKFRRDAPKILPRETLFGLTNFTDYYQMNMYRDLLFHVQEHRFDIPQIAAMLKELDLVFEGFYLSADTLARYGKMFPDDACKTNLDYWGGFEKEHPSTFMYMYNFWCRKAAAS
jgi:SAM-dependent methyltransferase